MHRTSAVAQKLVLNDSADAAPFPYENPAYRNPAPIWRGLVSPQVSGTQACLISHQTPQGYVEIHE